jgi:glycosyltransferase involved in cell wall biosynthesis
VRIVLVTSGQPSLNPRLVKEADALSLAGHEVTVLYTYWNDWGTTFDGPLLKSKPWKAIRAGGDPQQKPLTYLLSRILHKVAILGAKKLSLAYFAELAISRNSYWLTKTASAYDADLYIAHNPGALPAAVKTAKLQGKPCGFDAEDFHRNEVSNDLHHFDVLLKTHIENKYIPQTDYLTVSSPQIAEAYRKLFPTKKPVVILNVFNKNPDINIMNKNPGTPLKLFWFSQTIGTKRGIEEVLKALSTIKDREFELHLMGKLQYNISKEYFEMLSGHTSHRLHFHDPVAPDELTAFSSQFDLGLALEPAFSFNNDMALSNKIFTYMQAGLAIIASKTQAQHALLERYPEIGKLYEIGNVHSLSKTLLYYSENTDELDKARQASFNLAQTSLNWETEQSKFLKIIQTFTH